MACYKSSPHTVRQIGQTDKQTYRQTDRQTDKKEKKKVRGGRLGTIFFVFLSSGYKPEFRCI